MAVCPERSTCQESGLSTFWLGSVQINPSILVPDGRVKLLTHTYTHNNRRRTTRIGASSRLVHSGSDQGTGASQLSAFPRFKTILADKDVEAGFGGLWGPCWLGTNRLDVP